MWRCGKSERLLLAAKLDDYLTLPDGARNWPSIWQVPAVLGLAVAGVFLLFFKEAKHRVPH